MQGDPGFFPPIPVSDEPARLFFQTDVTGFNSNLPANGMISVHFDEQGKEGGNDFPGLPEPSLEIKVHEYREIIGSTSLFDYAVNYVSGINIGA